MISRNRSISTAAAMSIERTTSANSTVTCLYSAAVAAGLTGAPHLLQNRSPAAAPCRTTHTTVPLLSPHRDRPRWGPRQYRVTAGQRCPSYRRGTSDTEFRDRKSVALNSCPEKVERTSSSFGAS